MKSRNHLFSSEYFKILDINLSKDIKENEMIVFKLMNCLYILQVTKMSQAEDHQLKEKDDENIIGQQQKVISSTSQITEKETEQLKQQEQDHSHFKIVQQIPNQASNNAQSKPQPKSELQSQELVEATAANSVEEKGAELTLDCDQQVQSKNPILIPQQPNSIITISLQSPKKLSIEVQQDDQHLKQSGKTSKRLAKFRQKQKKMGNRRQNERKQDHVQNIQSHVQPIAETAPSRNIQSKLVKPSTQQNPIVGEVEMDEHKMLGMMILSKKRENHATLKEWDEKRAEDLSIHLTIVEGLERALDRLARSSFQNVEIYLSTFRSIFNQQQRSADFLTADVVELSQSNKLAGNVYLTCCCILDALIEENIERASKARKLSEHINVNVIGNCLDPHIKKSQQLVNVIKSRVSSLKSSIISLDTEIDTRAQKLSTLFLSLNSPFQQNKEKDQTHSKDLFENQIQFIGLVRKAYQIHQQYAAMVLEYFQIVKTMETQRIEIVKRAIRIYCEGLEDIYQSQTAKESLELLAKPEQTKLVQFYRLDEFLPQRLQSLIKERVRMEKQRKVEFQDLVSYLKLFEFTPLDLRQLVLKQYAVTSSTPQHKKLKFLITVDKFIHLIPNNQLQSSPMTSWKIDSFLKIKRKDNKAQLERAPESKGGMLGMLGWKTKNVEAGMVVFFESKDKAEEAEDYINKLI